MASLEDLEDLEQDQQEKRKQEEEKKKDGDDTKMDVDQPDEDEIDPDVLNSSTSDIINRRRLLENDLRVMKQELQRLTHDKGQMKDKIKENLEKIENNRYVELIPSSVEVWRGS
jgi:26S proteasome regulatory subunit T5